MEMAEYEEQPELSKADLAALDLVIAEMEERGIDKFTLDPEIFITAITPLVRVITKQLTHQLTHQITLLQNELLGGPIDKEVFSEEAVKAVNEGDITLEKLIEVRNQLRKQ
jgi:hypothetical protein